MEHDHNLAASSSSPQAATTTAITNLNDKLPVRTSSRLKAAREKFKGKEENSAEQANKRGRDQVSKGKGKETFKKTSTSTLRTSKRSKRATLPPTATPLTISEPCRDTKGKKRAAPETMSDEETNIVAKKARSSEQTKKEQSSKKSRHTTRSKSGSAEKMSSLPGPSRHDEDVEMMDGDCIDMQDDGDAVCQNDDDDDDDDDEEKSDEEIQDDVNEKPPVTPFPDSHRTLEQTMAMFDFGRLGGMSGQLTSHLRTLLNNIKPSASSTTRLLALQELSELLSISTEDSLAGSFQVDNFVKELVRILGGQGGNNARDEDGDEELSDDAALAAALRMSTGGALPGDDTLEAQLLACRCLANLLEALPGCGHTLVYHGAIPVLCSKLLEISYIDLAEQTLITLEKISEEYPSAIVREGGLSALLNFLDFFSIAVQRTALQAAANCLRNASAEYFSMIKDVWPIIRNCLGYADQRLVDFAALCVIRVIDSYHRSNADKLEILVDANLISAVNMLLLPPGGSSIIPTGTFTLLLKSMATAARSAPTIALTLLKADIVTTLYQILTGVMPPSSVGSEQGDSVSGQGLGGGLADMTIMQNLAYRPKEQVEEALTLIQELMPPLPKDGTFDHRGYSEKALYRMQKARVRAERAAATAASTTTDSLVASTEGHSATSSRAATPTGGATLQVEDDGTGVIIHTSHIPDQTPSKESSIDRTNLLRQHPAEITKFINLIVPLLIDVYAASVSVPVRTKSLASLLKAVAFQDEEQLKITLQNVPIASFASSILSAKDHPSLMVGALQLVELLLSKSTDFKPSFRREGVLHEIELLANRQLLSRQKEKEKVAEEQSAPTDPGHTESNTTSSSRRGQLLDPEDAYTLRACVIRLKYMSADAEAERDPIYMRLCGLVERFRAKEASLEHFSTGLKELSELFSSSHTTVSSFELLQSGLVDALLGLAVSEDIKIPVESRQKLILQQLAPYKDGKPSAGPSPLSVLVKKLQECLTRMEPFEVSTVSSAEESKRNSPSLLARQIRLKLSTEENSDSSRSSSGNIVVSIHAIATFQALNDYLRPRLSGILSSMSGPRFSGMLSALAAAQYQADGVASASSALSGSTALSGPSQLTSMTMNEPTKEPQRRRSQRLSAKISANVNTETERAAESTEGAATSVSVASSSTAVTGLAGNDSASVHEDISGEVISSETGQNHDDDDDDDDDLSDNDVDAEVLEEDLEDNRPDPIEKTVNLSMAADGSKMVAQTPEGTRVATPNPATTPAASSVGATMRASYAAALKNKASDWSLEFSLDGQVIPHDTTIFRAIHQHEARKAPGGSPPLNMIWQGTYNVKYRKVNGTQQPASEGLIEPSIRSKSPTSTSASLPGDAPHTKILRLLRILHKLNDDLSEETDLAAQPLPESAFVNNKLTAKLARQLEEPLIVASSCLPEWAMDLPVHYPFLFPFSTRFSFLQSTSFGYARLILKWQSQNRGQDSSRRDDAFGFLGRLQRQKVRISRKHILESAFKVFELYGSSSSVLEVEYFDEVGTGLGPTLEFYSLVSKEFARRDLKIWRDADATYPGSYVHHPFGLFPAPLLGDGSAEGKEKQTYVFKTIGQFLAKAMLDSRIIDLAFNKIFLRMILGEKIPLTLANLRLIDRTLANSLESLLDYVYPKDGLGTSQLGSIEDLCLDFTYPGYDIELREGGKNIPVTAENVHEYVDAILDATMGKGAELQTKAFREGFSKVFPVTDLQAFSPDELGLIFGSGEEDWSPETLMDVLKADHGYNSESQAIKDLVSIMSDFDKQTRRYFLQFITGSPKLPIGGFRGLNPRFTIVRKPHEAPYTADDYLPSVMTCVNYLKMPQYSTKEVMKKQLETAMRECVGSFHLS